MKKMLFVISLMSLLVLTGCGNNHGNYDLKCTGKYLFTTDVCFREDFAALSDSGEIDYTIDKVSLCGDVSNGTGDYYFYFEDGKVFIELEEEFNENFTDKYYEDMLDAIDDFKSMKRDCSLEKKERKSVFKCKKYDITSDFKDYNTKEKMKKLLEEKLEYSCN